MVIAVEISDEQKRRGCDVRLRGEGPVSVAVHHRHEIVAGSNEVELPIAVKVDGHWPHGLADVVRHAVCKRAVAIAEVKGRTKIRGDVIELAVTIEIAGHDRTARLGRDRHWRIEAAVSLSGGDALIAER